jgi:hypothetical protein
MTEDNSLLAQLENGEGGRLWTAAGHYLWTLERRDNAWKIAGIVFRLTFQDGNRALPAMAVTRGTAGQGRARVS